jgi:hypothetical protein
MCIAVTGANIRFIVAAICIRIYTSLSNVGYA